MRDDRRFGMTTFEHPSGSATLSEIENDTRRVHVKLSDNRTFSPLLECRTTYPDSLIQLIIDIKGPAWLCDEIARDEDRNYVQAHLETEMRAFFDFEAMRGKRILDFGCGSGASTMCLARLFPDSEIVGVELEESLLSIAEARRAHYGFANVRLMRSPSGMALPDGVGEFDLVVLSAVYEHLLPNERGQILRQVWSKLNAGGILFINQTPLRYFPLELHTTGLPLINYLPDRLTFWAAKKFSNRVSKTDNWESLLRAGIRGATVREIRSHLDARAALLQPTMSGLRDRVDLWFAMTNMDNLRTVKRAARVVLKSINAVTGIAIVPELSLAFRKSPKV